MNEFRTIYMHCMVGVLLATGSACDIEQAELAQLDSVEERVIEGDFTPEAISYAHGVLLIDRSSSMLATRAATGNTRCKDALTQAKEKVDRFFLQLNGTGVAVWLFNNSSITPLSSGYVSRTTALNLINNLSPNGCTGVTPLADAMCAAADGVAGTITLNPSPGYLQVATDGYENNSRGVCSGPPGDVFTPGTWQNKVFNRIFSRGVRPVEVAYWVSPTVLDSVGGKTVDPETGKLLPAIFRTEATPAASCSSVEECESGLFSTLAAYTGGQYGLVRDNDTDYPCAHGTCPPPKPPTGYEPWWQQD